MACRRICRVRRLSGPRPLPCAQFRRGRSRSTSVDAYAIAFRPASVRLAFTGLRGIRLLDSATPNEMLVLLKLAPNLRSYPSDEASVESSKHFVVCWLSPKVSEGNFAVFVDRLPRTPEYLRKKSIEPIRKVSGSPAPQGQPQSRKPTGIGFRLLQILEAKRSISH